MRFPEKGTEDSVVEIRICCGVPCRHSTANANQRGAPIFLVPQIPGELEGGVRPIDSHLLWRAL